VTENKTHWLLSGEVIKSN